ncbi:hypothetical protein MRB53_040889 [Persea americana]|nr:hypothetical protein MRB53_040889 [Persea americana]
MKSMTVLYSRIKSRTHPYAHFGIISLNRPSARNALSVNLVETLAAIIKDIEKDDSIRAIILNSTSNAFCAGADLVERRSMSSAEVSNFLSLMRRTFTALENAAMPTISVIEGHALGGGLELSLCTDLRILGGQAKVGLPETRLGIIPGAGGTQRLAKLIGPSKTKDPRFRSTYH